jgi:hypothetical protein
LKNIRPGQIPVTAEKRKKDAGKNKSQWAISNPVNQIPSHRREPVKKKKAFIDNCIISIIAALIMNLKIT